MTASAATLLAWSQPWFHLGIANASDTALKIDVSGSVAAPALAALALASLALVGALAISGPFFQLVMGFLAIAIGGCIALSGALAVGNPVAASAPAVSAVTGVSGTGSLATVVESSATTAWPILGFAAAAIMVAAGLGVFFTRRLWPSASQRHNRVRFESVPGAGAQETAQHSEDRSCDPVATWDDLSRGADPTK